MTVIPGVLQGMQSLAFCPDLATADTTAGGHNSLTDNNSLPSAHLSSPFSPSIHPAPCLPACLCDRKKKDDPSSRQLSFLCVNKHNWVCFVYCTKSVWLPRRLYVPSYIFVVCILSLAPSNTLRAFKISDWKEDYPTSTFVIFVGKKRKKQGSQKTWPSHPF